MKAPRWRPRLGREAERDFVQILQWTRDNFGPAQARRYSATLSAAIRALSDGPDVPGSRDASAVHHGARILHAARGKRRARHFLLYKFAEDHPIIIGRILHDAMDIERHVPIDDDCRLPGLPGAAGAGARDERPAELTPLAPRRSGRELRAGRAGRETPRCSSRRPGRRGPAARPRRCPCPP